MAELGCGNGLGGVDGDCSTLGIGDIFSDAVDWAGTAVSDAADAVTSIPILGDVIKATADVFVTVSGAGLIIDIATGKPVGDSIVQNFTRAVDGATTWAKYGGIVASFVPGIGTGVAAALNAGAALAQGKSITDAAIAGVRGAIPGGPLVQAGFDVAVKAIQGKNVAASALLALRNQVPGGAAGQVAFDIGVAVLTGQKAQQGGTQPSSGTPTAAPAAVHGPIVIDKPGWRLDAANGQWCYDAAGYCTPANIGDRNSITGEVYVGKPAPVAAPVAAFAVRNLSLAPRILRPGMSIAQQVLKLTPAPPAPAAPVHPAAAAPAPAKKWSTGKKVAGVGAAVGLAYTAWRIAAMV
jgi:hypothetical protein